MDCLLSSMEITSKLNTVSNSPAYNLNTDSGRSARKVTLQSMEFLSKGRMAKPSVFCDIYRVIEYFSSLQEALQ